MHHFVNFSLVVVALTLFCSNFGGITARRAAVARDDSDALAPKAPSAEVAEVVAAAESVKGEGVPKNKETHPDSFERDEVDPHDKYDKVERDKIEPDHVLHPEPTKAPVNHTLVRRAAKAIDEAGALPAKSEVHADNPALQEALKPAKIMDADSPAAPKAPEPAEVVVHVNNPAPLEAHDITRKVSANHEAGKLLPNNAGQPDQSADSVGQLDLAGKSQSGDEVGKMSLPANAAEKDKTTKVKSDDTVERKDAVLSPRLVNLEGKEVLESKRRMLQVQKLDGGSDTTIPNVRTTVAPSNAPADVKPSAGNATTDKSDTSTTPPNGQMNNSGDAASTLLVTVFSYLLASGNVLCYLDNFGLYV